MKQKNQLLISEDEKYIAKCSRAPYLPIVANRAKGVIVEDLDGNEYIDMISSACVLNTGYNHENVLDKVSKQLDKFIHFSNDYFYTEPQVELAKKLVKITPGNFEKKVIFGFSGSDSIDSAIKATRSYTGRSKIISFVGAYHGSTYGAISISAIDLNMKKRIGPLLPDVFHFSYPLITEKKNDETEDEYSDRKFEEFKKPFDYYLPVEEVAAIFIEPIAGDLGLIPPPKKFMKLLRKFCSENGILLVADEIQQGFGRTGKWFSIEHFDVEADLIVMGKAMASGFPMSAVVGRREIIDSIAMPGQLFTLQGNAVCAGAAIATIEIIENEKLLDRAVKLGDYIKERFKLISKNSSVIKDVRGLGLTIGVELEDRNKIISSSDIAKKICYRCFEKGVILIYIGGNTLRVQPPLVMTNDEAQRAMNIIEEVFCEYENGKISDSILDKIQGW
ncbi:aminotransferase class III-fold pyridoxal phosphate-dependent enzyme [Peptoniphilus sp. oral taxon 386]|uniref:aminotransferase class III-fold pyridoxal phosphate-dependent enzyme n=1 Tax=Peptoniphilus sp. oral taxon 386 TaxID=652713 RepID=UPI0001DA9D19|nr:aminotransferase class III-fold pyridoxal phosphate-dependent enzyme [Peptoniphilus sp. oral taxon 386]EFI42682.1 putative 4-aminobutyrate transaminase [Peptoniphilus sp. oral taxon 386 str. F0131]